MFCPYCGNACNDTHTFCFRCGKQLPDLSELNPPAEEIAKEAPAAETPVETEETVPVPQEIDEPVPPESEALEKKVEPAAESPVPVPPPAKEGRLWPPLVLLIIMACIGLGAFLGKGTPAPDPNACFSIENGTLFFDYSLYTGPSELTIPATVDGVTVTAISNGCFADCDGLTTVILPETVTKIGNNAFSNCDDLRGIYIPEGVTTVGAGAFAGCTALEAVYFPYSTVVVGNGCLDRCENLRFLFYDGSYERWLTLYNGTYPSGMELHTADGVFYAQP